MKNRLTQLRVKIRYLTKEAHIIRHEEARAVGRDYDLFRDLMTHRKGPVRREARHSLLAYGFLRGLPYARMEAQCAHNNQPDLDTVRAIAMRFGPVREREETKENFVERVRAVKANWQEWKEAAENYLKEPMPRQLAKVA